MIRGGRMAVLGDSERFEVWAQIMRELPMPGVTKPELRAAVNALDTWLNDNAAADTPPRGLKRAEALASVRALQAWLSEIEHWIERGER